MGREYKIEWDMPEGYEPSAVLRNLPSPLSSQMTEIYNFKFEDDGFYLLDNLVDPGVAGYAMKLFVDETLAHSDSVRI